MSDQRPVGQPYEQQVHGQPPYRQPAYPGWVPPAATAYPAGPAPLPPGISPASYGWVWGVAGVLALSVVAAVGLGVLFLTGGPQTYGDDPRLDALWDSCERGSMRACDRLFEESPLFSEYEEFGLSCGGRDGLAMTCSGSAL